MLPKRGAPAAAAPVQQGAAERPRATSHCPPAATRAWDHGVGGLENKSSTENKALSAGVFGLLLRGAVPFRAWTLIATKEGFYVTSTVLFSWGVLKKHFP